MIRGRDGRIARWAALVAGAALACGVPAPARAATHPTDRRIFLPLVAPPTPVLPPLVVGMPAGYHDRPFEVGLSIADRGAAIRYTLDGSMPSAEHGQLYTGPIPVGGTTLLRAVAYRPGYEPTAVASASYLFPAQALVQGNPGPGEPFPLAWGRYPADSRLAGLLVPADYAMDPKVVQDPITRDRILADLKSLPAVSLIADPEDLWGAPGIFGARPGIYAHPLSEGDAWERPVSVELILPDGRRAFQVDAGLRIAGQWSRRPDVTPKHSFSLRFRERYGADRLEYPLIPGSPVTRFDTLRLRAGQADAFLYTPLKALYVHDQVGRDSQLAIGQPAARGTFVQLYVNGRYWGLYNLAEEVTAGFAADHLGGKKSEYDVVKGLEVTIEERGHSRIEHSFEVEDGDDAAFRDLLALRDAGPAAEPQRLAEAERLLDVDAFAAYTLLEIYFGNDDWEAKNWRALRRKGPPVDGPGSPGGRWLFQVWDIERTAFLRLVDPLCGSAAHRCGDGRAPDPADISGSAGVLGLHGWLKAGVDYRLRVADQARRLFFGDGPLAPGPVGERYRGRLAEVDRAIVTESARWGDVNPRDRYPIALRDNPTYWLTFWSRFRHPELQAVQRRDPEWLDERRRLLEQAVPARTGIVIEQLCRQELLPPAGIVTISANPQADSGEPVMVRLALEPGGCPGAEPGGQIVYTLDGSDPRRPGSGQSGAWWSGEPGLRSRLYERPLPVEGHAEVRARHRVEGPQGPIWGPLSRLAVGRPAVAISEIMYKAPEGESDFLELHNEEALAVDLSGASFQGVTLTLPPGSVLPPGAHAVVVEDAADFRARYGPAVPILGEYQGGLAAEGERIRLLASDGQPLAEARYSHDAFWPQTPNGLGFSLVYEPHPERADPEDWRASSRPGGSPGAEDPPPQGPRVLISEILPSATTPYEDAVELYNTSLGPADVSGWYLSDTPDDLKRFRFPPGSVVPPGGYLVAYEDQLRGGGGGGPGFSLGSRGEGIYLTAARRDGGLSGFSTGAPYGPVEENRSLGRYQTRPGVLGWTRLQRPTFGVTEPADVAEFRTGRGAPNAPPQVGPVYIAEVDIVPRLTGWAYAELANLGEADQPLLEPNGRPWRLEGRLNLSFPPGTVLPAGGRIVVTEQDPATFRARHDVPADVPVLGPAKAGPARAPFSLALLRPLPDQGSEEVPVDILIEQFGDSGPPYWPSHTRREGPAERLEPPRFAGEPQSWVVIGPGGSPGRETARLVRRNYLPWLNSSR